jgi:hypothetical protein
MDGKEGQQIRPTDLPQGEAPAPARDIVYRGERTKQGCQVSVHDGPGRQRELVPTGCYSAVDFDWGRHSAEAWELGLSVLAAVFGEEPRPEDLRAVHLRCVRLHDRFVYDRISTLPYLDPWHMWHSEILAWAESVEPVAAGSSRAAV